MSFPIELSTTPVAIVSRAGAVGMAAKPARLPVLQPLSGGATIVTGAALAAVRHQGPLPVPVLEKAIELADGKGPAVIVHRDAAHQFFLVLDEAVQQFVLDPAPVRLEDGTRLLPVNGGHWTIMLMVTPDGSATARAFRRGLQRHETGRGIALWLPGFAIDPEPTPLPHLPAGLLPDAAERLEDAHVLAATRWFWTVANPTLADPFLARHDEKLEGLEKLAWRKGSLDDLMDALRLVFWSDPLFAASRQPLHLQLPCLMPTVDGRLEGSLSFVSNTKARFDDARARKLLKRILAENQPVCRRMTSSTSKASGLAPAPISLSVTIEPAPTAHQVIAATAGIEDWAITRGIAL